MTVELSPRQREVMQWTAEGKTCAEIAAIMGVAESTIRHHRMKVFEKLGVVSAAHAIALCFRQGLIQ